MPFDLEKLIAPRLASYEADPGLLREHYGLEEAVLAGGYGYRQILELVQNGADAILEGHDSDLPAVGPNRVHVILGPSHLYVANSGAPLSEAGLDALLRAHSSPKRGNQIGRFGLGFKSLLKLGGTIDLITRDSGSVRFDPERCRGELRARFNVDSAPGLRLAWTLDSTEARRDPVCSRLEWAETIVRVEVPSPDAASRLREEIGGFPSEFLLFFPVPTVLILDDGETEERHLQVSVDGDRRVLFDGREESTWLVPNREVRISDHHALDDATHLHARTSVPIAWAFPLDGMRERAGRFWAFFPTQTDTFIPGILNAPWKLNSDRNAIIGGEWNSALMAEAAGMISETIPILASIEDPGRPLDAFPRRVDHKGVEAAPLVKAVWSALEDSPVIPDATGTLRSGAELWRHPKESAELARSWKELSGTEGAEQFVHPTCMEGHRQSRLKLLSERLLEREASPESPLLRARAAVDWFQAVATTDERKAFAVLRVAEAYAEECVGNEWKSIRDTLAIIPSDSGGLIRAAAAVLAPPGSRVPSHEVVAEALQRDPDARRILVEVLNVVPLSDELWGQLLDERLSGAHDASRWKADEEWREFWSLLHQAPAMARTKFVQGRSADFRVLRRDGRWVDSGAALLPGRLVRADDPSSNAGKLLDEVFHEQDEGILETLGLTDKPDGVVELQGKVLREVGTSTLSGWLQGCRRSYKDTFDNRASWTYLEPQPFTMPRGFRLLRELEGLPNSALTTSCLERMSRGEFPDRVEFGHATVSHYPSTTVPHPLPWWLLEHGSIAVGEHSVPLAAVHARRHLPWKRILPTAPRGWVEVLARLSVLDSAFPHISPSDEDVQLLWASIVDTCVTPDNVLDYGLSDLWDAAAHDGFIPTVLPFPDGDRPLSSVYVTDSRDLATRARSEARMVLSLKPAALEEWVKAGAQELAEVLRPSWQEATGPADLLVNILPELADVLEPEARETAVCRQVRELKLEIGESSVPVPCLLWDKVLHVDADQLASLSRTERLANLLEGITPSGWLALTLGEALVLLGASQVAELRAYVRAGASLSDRLLRAVGGRKEPLIGALGGLGELDFISKLESEELAALTLAHLGPATLTKLADTLREEGLHPPGRWTSVAAQRFVATIGFPPEFAASATSRREPEEIVSGPIVLPPLHDFQVEVLGGIEALLGLSETRRRAVVSLPTGGGKTRVTVEAAVRLVLEPLDGDRTVVWIAQTDELCEQAVQAFREVWINRGAERTDLRIVRLWGGNANPSPSRPDEPVAVVASIQTLNSRMSQEDLSWLREPGLVVVDECHHAITPSYTNLLRWLDAYSQASREDPEPPILGLSATPFRSDDEESRRLANRFDSRWLPSDQASLHARLREQGVLSKIIAEELESGVGLSADELKGLSELVGAWEGIEFENLLEQINQRLGKVTERNEALVTRIAESEESSILLFANSVAHAEEMSARLNLEGIAAAAVSGRTPTSARRHFLEAFQSGHVRVICNHTVLSTGFDAPKIEMILISRAVFSPVRYMQMVGRGLRGELNGGTEACRIVTVLDNLGRFQDKHPYNYCRRYFGDEVL